MPKIPLAQPFIGPEERALVAQVLDSSFLSIGPMLERFEADFAAYHGCAYAVGVNSGTSGLLLALLALTQGRRRVVYTSPFSFIASAAVVLHAGCELRFVDVDAQTGCLDVDQLQAQVAQAAPATLDGAVVLVPHIFCQTADLSRLSALAAQTGLTLLEDACEVVGARHCDRLAGTWGAAGVFGFYPNKQLTTGEGGMLITDDAQVAARCRSLRNQGRDEAGWLEHARLGWNFRLPELSAALGVAQLARLDAMLALRAKVAAWYDAGLAGLSGLAAGQAWVAAETTRASWFVYPIRLASTELRQRVMSALAALDVPSRVYFPALHLQPALQVCGYGPGAFPITERLAATTLVLPFGPLLSEAEVAQVCGIIRAVLT